MSRLQNTTYEEYLSMHISYLILLIGISQYEYLILSIGISHITLISQNTTYEDQVDEEWETEG